MSDDIGQRLWALGGALFSPPAPDIAAALHDRLADRRSRRTMPTRRTLALALAAIVLMAGGAMALPASRHTILRVLGLRGVVVHRVPRLAPAPGGRDRGTRLGLGQRIPLARARHAAQFTALLPSGGAVAYIAHDVPGGRISLLIGGVMVTEFRGTAFPFVFKLVGPATRVTRLRVDGGPGLYLAKAPHEVVFRTQTGAFASDRIRVAGNVLLWQQGPLTLRIEGTHSLGQALALARSLRGGGQT